MIPHIHWRGKGWKIAAVIFLCSLFSELFSEYFTDNEAFYQTNPYPLSFALFISGIVTYYMFYEVHLKADPNPLENQKTENKSNTDSFIFISAKYWPWILIFSGFINFAIRKI